MEQNADQEISPYSLTDVGVLYLKISSALEKDELKRISDKELDKIKEAGIKRPHSGLVERVYEVLNERALRAKGATEEHVYDFLKASAEDNLGKMVSIAQLYSIKFNMPTEKELDRGLRNAVATGEYSIDEKGTSAGWFYQKMFGDECRKIACRDVLTKKVPGDDGKEKEEQEEIIIKYDDFSRKEKEHVNKQLLVRRGYLSRDELEKPEKKIER